MVIVSLRFMIQDFLNTHTYTYLLYKYTWLVVFVRNSPFVPRIGVRGRPRTFPPRAGATLPPLRTGFPRPGAVHNLTYDGFTVRSRAHPRCPFPLDSGFRRNDGGYAQHPSAGMTLFGGGKPSFRVLWWPIL